MMELERFITVARGEEPADLIIEGGQVVNVLSGEIYAADVAVADGLIVGLGAYAARERYDAGGLYVTPSFIDAHIHLESSMLTPREFARAVVPRGTTTVVADPHEIANVLGVAGIEYMLESSRDLPLSVFLMLPSCVPATDLETAGARLGAPELASLMEHPRVLGLAEVMNHARVLARDPDVLAKLRLASQKRINGHAPGLSGKELNAYAGAGIRSDHECTAAEEALAKLRAGMHVFIREGSVAGNLAALVPIVTSFNAARCGLVTDDVEPHDLHVLGHMDHCLRKAVQLGLPALSAMQMVTINAANYFALNDRGALAPGYRADIVLLNDLREFRARAVFKDGHLVAREGRLTTQPPATVPAARGTVSLDWQRIRGFAIRAEGQTAKVIEVVPEDLHTRALLLPVAVRDGLAVADPGRDICQLAVVERHHGTGNVGLGFVRGFGLRAGALASSFAHDSHNIVVTGTTDADMLCAVRAVERMQGGLVAVKDGAVLAELPLPVAGLLSEQPLEYVAAAMQQLTAIAQDLGSRLRNPYVVLSFLALPVIPVLRLTDRGLVDVNRRQLVPLFGDG